MPETEADNGPGPVEGPLVEGVDYYFENGLVVFTAAYHLRRGYCCGSGCRHCPWAEWSAVPAPE